MSDTSSLFRLSRLEFRKLRKGASLYIIAAVIILFSILISSNASDSYNFQVRQLDQNYSEIVSQLDAGHMVLFSNFIPDDFDWRAYPVNDEEGNPIPENIEFWKDFYRDAVQAEKDKLTAEDGRFSLAQLTSSAAISFSNLIPVLGVAAGVSLFAGEFRNSTYRLMLSRGIRRNSLMSAKILTVIGMSLFFALVLGLAVTLSGYMSYSGLSAAAPAAFSFGAFLSIIWLGALMFLGYTMGGAALGILLASPVTAMTVGLIIAFVGGTIFLFAHPGMDGIIGSLSPLSLGYNYGSMIQETWVNTTSLGVTVPGEGRNDYRDLPAAFIGAFIYISLYTTVVFTVFGRKELKA
ncbi:MAG: ABC transporter permease subunit [Dehalogenimonas sp.]|uniref:ABC transporter permease subunit n=1 Tax=Candidatus Dehalogenimonas loeffleri TaxID=3127115 RepID=A0ABZ2JBI4_9CHLR|nr:ABC transporter permease subunit [Dehalogenimonas sp.]